MTDETPTPGGEAHGAASPAAAIGRRVGPAGRTAGDFLRYAVARFRADLCVQTASSLTYTTLLAIVPLMTIMVAIVAAFPAFGGLEDRFKDRMFESLVPEVGSAVLDHLETFTANAGRITGVGVVGLIVTSVLLLFTIEGAFNRIWRVGRGRRLITRLLSFWAVLSLTPLLTGASLSLTVRVLGEGALDEPILGVQLFVGIVPLVFEFLGLTVLYLVIPNKPVRWVDAAVGGAVAAVLFEICKSGFALYVRAFPVYDTIYGALSTIPIFLVWLYVTWAVVLFGAVVTASLPDFRSSRRLGATLDSLLPGPRLTLAVALLSELAAAQRAGGRLSRRALDDRVPVGLAALDGMLETLARSRFVARTDDDRWIVARDLSQVSVRDLMRALGIGLSGPVGRVRGLDGPWRPRLTALVDRAEAVEADIYGEPLSAVIAPGEDKAAVRRLRRGEEG
ncbi:MAG: YihY family inner membrane protein [Azospirillaceae bacterium]